MRRIDLLIACSLCLSAAASAQDPAPAAVEARQAAEATVQLHSRTHEEREATYRAQHREIVNVLVTDESGHPVTGLKQEDFSLGGGQNLEKLRSVRAVEDNPASSLIHIILVLDALNISERDFSYERKEVEKFLTRNEGRLAHKVSLTLLINPEAKSTRASKDGNVLAADLKAMTHGLRLASCAEEAGDVAQASQIDSTVPFVSDAAQMSAQSTHVQSCESSRFRAALTSLESLAQAESSEPGRAVLIWIGPGWPLMTGKNYLPDSRAMKLKYYDYLADLSTDLMDAQVTVNGVSAPEALRSAGFSRAYYEPYLRHVPTPEDAGTTDLALPVIARRTGGQVLESSRDIAAEIASCIADVDFYYVLTFDGAPSTTPNEFRKIDVKVDRPGVTVRTDTVYYAQP